MMKLIYDAETGPLAALKKAFMKQIRLMIIVPAILFATNLKDTEKVFTSVLFWSYVLFCLMVIAFSYVNYRLVSNMQSVDARVKTNLETQVQLLEKRLKWRTAGVKIALVFMILLTEITPYFQHYRMLDKWHALHPVIRFGSYALLLLLQHFLSSRLNARRYGGHLLQLKELVSQLQD